MKPATLSGILRHIEKEHEKCYPSQAGDLTALVHTIDTCGVDHTLRLYAGRSIELDQEELKQ